MIFHGSRKLQLARLLFSKCTKAKALGYLQTPRRLKLAATSKINYMSQEIQQIAEVAHEVTEVSHATGGLGTLGINVKIFIAQLVNFVVVLLVFWKWAYKPIIKLLDQRSERIEKSMKDAEEVDKRLSNLDEDQKKLLAETKKEASEILDDARTQAENQKSALLEKAKTEVEGVVVKGKAQLQAEKVQMIRDAKTEIAAIAVEASKKILEDSIDKDKSQQIAKDVVDQMTK